MSLLTFYYPILDALNRGSVIRKAVAIGVRAIGVLIALGGLAGVITLLKLTIQPNVPPEATVGGLLLAVLVAIAMLCVVQICFYRARGIAALPDSDYTVVPIISITARAIGEITGTIGIAAGVGGFFAILLSGPTGAYLLRESGLPGIFLHESSSQSSFVAALFVLAYAATMSFASILFFYFLAEISVALVDVAQRLEQRSGTISASAPAAAKCVRCGAVMEADSAFCEQCGAVRAAGTRSA